MPIEYLQPGFLGQYQFIFFIVGLPLFMLSIFVFAVIMSAPTPKKSSVAGGLAAVVAGAFTAALCFIGLAQISEARQAFVKTIEDTYSISFNAASQKAFFSDGAGNRGPYTEAPLATVFTHGGETLQVDLFLQETAPHIYSVGTVDGTGAIVPLDELLSEDSSLAKVAANAAKDIN